MVPNTVLRLLDREGRGLYFWIFIQELIERVVALVDEVDRGVDDSVGMTSRQGAEVIKVEEESIPVVGSQMKGGQEIGSKNPSLDVGNDEVEGEVRLPDCKSAVLVTEASNIRAVGGT